MTIDFSLDRWEEAKANYRAWWAGDRERPLMQFNVWKGADRPEPALPDYAFTAFYDLSIPTEQIIDRWDYNLSGHKFLGDSFPHVFPNFGPGVIAAFTGCDLEVSISAQTCWFAPRKDVEIGDLRFVYDPEDIWFNRIKDICRLGDERWGGLVQIGMTDLGGNLDILSSFRPGEKLLLDLYDHTEAVKERTWEAHEMWWRYFEELNALMPRNPGYTTWAPIFSEIPYYMLQCDFCYMIGPDTFDEFVLPELAASCKRLGNAFYHLDGPGELPHLDSLLSIPELKGIQWVPGAGVPQWEAWPDLYRKIRKAGKLIQIYGGPETLDAVVEHVGGGEGIILLNWGVDEELAVKCLKKYGAV